MTVRPRILWRLREKGRNRFDRLQWGGYQTGSFAVENGLTAFGGAPAKVDLDACPRLTAFLLAEMFLSWRFALPFRSPPPPPYVGWDGHERIEIYPNQPRRWCGVFVAFLALGIRNEEENETLSVVLQIGKLPGKAT